MNEIKKIQEKLNQLNNKIIDLMKPEVYWLDGVKEDRNKLQLQKAKLLQQLDKRCEKDVE